ncbi:ribosome assembly RNA-binding protein YhbY [Candidatus Heimdallarchaeota archaeon]|nr:MAG: ribosome assembly RNA-binding protein YhbY [Candidatus Heimdallarchaeota archaeon]RLI71060.1 MAG: ribosome assembly RNA-binding protein YhbY [Candidatus Gerdarchaeota archaeon]
MTKNLKRALKEQLLPIWNQPAKVNVGKHGLTEAIFTAIDHQLASHTLIKVKFLQNFESENLQVDIQTITKKTQSQLVEKRGKTIILYRPAKQE